MKEDAYLFVDVPPAMVAAITPLLLEESKTDIPRNLFKDIEDLVLRRLEGDLEEFKKSKDGRKAFKKLMKQHRLNEGFDIIGV